MGRRRAEEPEELDDDLDEAERGETEEPAPPASRATPEETRALDRRIFDAADRLEAKLGRPATQPEIAAAAKVPGLTETARRVRVSKAMRRRALLTEPAKKPSSGERPHRVQDAPIAPAAPSKPLRHVLSVAPTLIEALVAERARLSGIVARLDATIADLGGAS